ncbi:maltose O-acetyltransferase [Aeromonas encheleia]|uniref:acyltransferase n=1 Tax=Aeromonas encheleia TaxID=73010 RepID=UPI000A06B7DC|nr:acyltransferase [Aeromonas encheleia]VEG97224.1 maltose O-acetyltransferase [Aeromonas encheleia]
MKSVSLLMSRSIYIIAQVVIPLIKYFKAAILRAKIFELKCHCSSSAIIQVDSWYKLTLEPKVCIGHGSLIIVSDEKSANGITSSLRIGEGTSINEYTNIRAAGGDIYIGKHCMIAQFVTIVASNHVVDLGGNMIEHEWDNVKRNVSIGDNTWIGAGSIILPGVTIGSGCVIAAGSVVTHDVLDNQIVVGAPAKLLRARVLS